MELLEGRFTLAGRCVVPLFAGCGFTAGRCCTVLPLRSGSKTVGLLAGSAILPRPEDG